MNQMENLSVKPSAKVKIIKRYQNRKLYDTQQSCYVTLDDIAKMIRSNEEVMVIDNKSKNDITAATLTQIIFESEKKASQYAPLFTLREIIQTGNGSISNYLANQSRKVVFCHTINCDPHVLVDRVKRVHELGGNGVHINVFSGYGSYNSIRKLDLPLFLHYQSSGAKVTTDVRHRFSISWPVMCQLATLMGVDTIQTGMVGGYSNDDPDEIKVCLDILRAGNTLPALSCGMHPGLIDRVTEIAGINYLANAGGSVHGHPGGTVAGAMAMRQSVDKNYGPEYQAAIEKWGYK